MVYLLPLSSLASLLLFLGLSSSSPLFFSLLFSSLTGVMVLLLLLSGATGGAVTLYLVEESVSMWIIFIFLLLGGSEFIFLLLLVNGAFAPLHNWLLEAFSMANSDTLVWGLTFHKIPLLIFLSALSCSLLWLIAFFSFSLGVVFMMNIGDSNNILILSSSNTLLFIVLYLSLNTTMSLLYFLAYITIFWSSWSISSLTDSILVLLGISGVPPLLLFQLKWSVLYELLSDSLFMPLLLVLFSGSASAVYIRFAIVTDWSPDFASVSFFLWWIIISVLLPTF